MSDHCEQNHLIWIIDNNTITYFLYIDIMMRRKVQADPKFDKTFAW